MSSRGTMSAAQGLLNSVFSCSSPASKAITKRRLRQTRSLDPAIIRHCDTDRDGGSGLPCVGASGAPGDAGASPERKGASLRARIPTIREPIGPSLSSPSIPLDVSPSSNFQFDYDPSKLAKRNTAADLPVLVRAPGAAPSGTAGTLFSPRRWLQKKAQPSSPHAYVVWRSEVRQFTRSPHQVTLNSIQLWGFPPQNERGSSICVAHLHGGGGKCLLCDVLEWCTGVIYGEEEC